jgi:hypothetical protein
MRIPESLKIQCAEMANKSVAYREIYETVFLPEHQGMSFETFRHKIRGWRKSGGTAFENKPAEISEQPESAWEHEQDLIIPPRLPERIDTYGKPVGVFSDPHIPFNHPNYLRFCADTFKRYGVGRVVCCGDLVDFHALSRHETQTCAKSPLDEFSMTLEGVREFVEAFPDVDLILGNHDMICARQAATLGIDKRFLKSFSELFELPKTWRIHDDEAIIDGVLYKHGINCIGKNGALNTAIQERMSTVIGHSHAFGGCSYSANKRDIIFGLNCGCGIDIAAYAFAYGRHDKNRPTIGCGIVHNSGHAEFIPMGAEYFRN